MLKLEIHLSDASATERIDMLSKTYPNLPIVIFFASSTYDIVAKAFEHGVQGFIPKPSSITIVIAAMRLVLKGGSIYLLMSSERLESNFNLT